MLGVIARDHVVGDRLVNAPILQLREWGTERIHTLPTSPARHGAIGTAEACTVRLNDPAVLSIHAHLRRDAQQWMIRALDRDMGLLLDGSRRDAFMLSRGIEIGIGRTTLVAEDQTWIDVRSFCARLLGWGQDHTAAVDRALRSLHTFPVGEHTCADSLGSLVRRACWVGGDSDIIDQRDLGREIVGTQA
jgi:hypothetical protein